MAVLLPGGRIQRGGAGPGREAVAVGEAGDVADVGEDPSSDDGSDTPKVHQVGVAGQDHGLELGVGLLDRGLDRDQLGQLVGGKAAAGLSRDVTRTHASQHRLA